MTASPSSPRLTLKVVSPSTPPPSTPSPHPHPPTPSSIPNPQPLASNPPSSLRPWLITGAIAATLVGVSFIPTSFEVGGSVVLEAKQGNRRQLTTPISGIIDWIDPAIQPGTVVKKGQTIAKLRSRELEQAIAQVEQEMVAIQQQQEDQLRRQIRADAEVKAAIAQAEALEQQAQLVRQLAQSTVPSQMQEIQAKINTQRQLLVSTEQELQRYDSLARNGAIPLMQRDKVQRERDRVAGELIALEQSLASTQQKLTQEVQVAEIQTSRQSLIIAAEQQKVASERQMTALHDRLLTTQKRLTQLQQDKNRLTLRAPIDGVVITPGFDLKLGKELKTDQELMAIVNVKAGLTGQVEIAEQDIGYVEPGKPVRFRLSRDKLRTFDAKVEKLIPNVQADQTEQKRTLSVLISVQNPDGQLQNGSSGFAYVYSEQIPVYERVRREIVRLFSFERL
ncbi:MAG: efflux RND transporter periplasmic adaptor subunit [Leptolyngbyaceae cyanobacterium bins.302]|nr:efflux RND transporter periplasmic adaptor subunit [Leptolyngbyaceae cyanobacterium bins.302]